jgi:hypothetical protein
MHNEKNVHIYNGAVRENGVDDNSLLDFLVGAFSTVKTTNGEIKSSSQDIRCCIASASATAVKWECMCV